MQFDWYDFKKLHGGIESARSAFEDVCETLYKKKHPTKHVSKVEVKCGDGGIDIFIGELGIEPMTVIQCKFFLESFGKAQYAQIRKSFDTAIKSDTYELKEWILCIPRVIDIEENSWWFKWKHKKLKEFTKDSSFIKIVNGNELITELKNYDLYDQVFQNKDSLKIDEIYKKLCPKQIISVQDIDLGLVLFNNYCIKCEPYYITRAQDNEFNNSLNLANIWVHGISGTGKTAMINRNLLFNGITYCYCDLSPVTITSADDILEEMICTIEEKYHVSRIITISNKIKQINDLLCRLKQDNPVFVIDELSITDSAVLESIVDTLSKLVISHNNLNTSSSIKFIVSTIFDPYAIIQNFDKTKSYFHFICCDDWDSYMSTLFDVICCVLKLDLSNDKSEIIYKSKNSPRLLKSILKKTLITNCVQKSIKNSLNEVINQ